MAYIPKFLSRPFQGLMMAGNGLWSGDWNVPRWAIGTATENEDDLKSLKAKPAQVNQKVVERIKKSYKTLGLDYEKAARDPGYVDKAFKQVMGKMKAAGVDIDDYTSIDDIAAAYDKMSGEQKKIYAEYDGSAGPQKGAPATDSAGKSKERVSNGKNKSPASTGTEEQAEQTPLPPRTVPDPEASTTQINSGTTNTDTVVDGLSDRNQTDIVNNLEGAARDKTGVLRTNAKTAKKDAESAERIAEKARRIREEQAKEKLSDKARADRKRRHESRMADIMDDRYKNRLLRDANDWENLGRHRAGDITLSQDAYNKKVEKLLGRAKALRSNRAGMDDKEFLDMKALFKIVGKVTKGEDGNYSGDFTNAQLEALDKRITGFETSRDNRIGKVRAQLASLDRDDVAKYREQYGLDGFSDEDVRAFRERRKKSDAKGALDELVNMKAPKTSEDVEKFDAAWDKLRKNTNITAAFDRAIADNKAKEAYMDTIAGLSPEEREAHRKATIIGQLRKEAESELVSADNNRNNVVTRSLNGEGSVVPGGNQFGDMPVASGIPDPALKARKGEEVGTRQAYKGGDVLRPRKKVV